MIKPRIGYLFSALLGLMAALPVAAADAVAADALREAGAAATACPAPGEPPVSLASVNPTDCCKGHKGVCGCRAGKIVCCDNTVSPNCACHADDGFIH